MKKLVKIFSVLLVLAGSASANIIVPADPESEKTKSYTKTYPVGSSDRILLDNSFGEMKISTWSKNEIKVDVNITVKASTDARVQKIMDDITIEDGKNGSEIFFKTHFKGNDHDGDDDREHRSRNRDHNDGDHENNSMKINYTVYLPANATLEATNQFGAMSIGDFDGVVTLNSKFGSLTAGKLSQPKKVNVQFGKATIESMNNGKLTVNFSRAQVNKLSGDVTADFEQSHGVKLNLDNNLKKLDIHNSFSDIYLDAEKNLSASFDIKSSFGSFSNKSDFSVGNKKDDDGFVHYGVRDNTYTGKAGSGNIPITVKSSFGHVTLGHAIAFDVNERGSSNRNRNRDDEKVKDKEKDKSEKKRTRV